MINIQQNREILHCRFKAQSGKYSHKSIFSSHCWRKTLIYINVFIGTRLQSTEPKRGRRIWRRRREPFQYTPEFSAYIEPLTKTEATKMISMSTVGTKTIHKCPLPWTGMSVQPWQHPVNYRIWWQLSVASQAAKMFVHGDGRWQAGIKALFWDTGAESTSILCPFSFTSLQRLVKYSE